MFIVMIIFYCARTPSTPIRKHFVFANSFCAKMSSWQHHDSCGVSLTNTRIWILTASRWVYVLQYCYYYFIIFMIIREIRRNVVAAVASLLQSVHRRRAHRRYKTRFVANKYILTRFWLNTCTRCTYVWRNIYRTI